MIQGIINVLKPSGMSSHDIIGQVRRIYGMKKVGHSGTLDPLAAGVLPVFLGQATRLIEYCGDEDKTYRAEFVPGFATDTEDGTGTVVETRAVSDLEENDILDILPEFTGTIKQRPSRYSAINVNGVKAYKLARQRADFELPEREVTVHSLRLLAMVGRRVFIEVSCSKGTYIRSLIRDMGERLGTLATMTYLVRSRVGDFSIDAAATIEELALNKDRFILPVDTALGHMRRTLFSRDRYEALLQGRAVPFARADLRDGDILRLYVAENGLVGIGRFDEAHHVIRPHKMFSQER
ncbi:tRNA pseudouridine(55) synthase TruB [Colibacter massiliensis]|uniref:tRNA pseudouridine(55) synthase TruB n=1 Tax=Colibacter massiliensis TaxID=1852379 RepID=UPI00094E921E|nr:tRNA pseudouridine(55) synthase TruB [Colibacter massiliensis]